MDKTIDIQLIKAIKEKCDKSISFIDEVALILDINYDAAYRRVNNKTAISLKDAIKLTKHFNISINELYNYDAQNKLIIKKTKEIKNAVDLESYFNNLAANLAPLKKTRESKMLYSAKDLPLFYVLSDNLLSKFKLYVWLYILNSNLKTKHTPFENFNIPLSLQLAAQKAGNAYKNVQISEVWNYGIINSIINQISFFFETNLLNYNNAIKICDDLKRTIQEIEISSHNGYREDINNTKFNLYHNELLILNNNMLLNYKNQKTLISPYSLLKYYLIEDQSTCEKFETFIENQIIFSKLISKTGVKGRLLFFRPKYEKIDKLKQRIELIRQYPLK